MDRCGVATQRLDEKLDGSPRWRLGAENAFETVVWETPVSRARVRNDGQPARWCRSCNASFSEILGSNQ